MTDEETPGSAQGRGTPDFAGHLAIARVEHWFKNGFVIPGIVVAITVSDGPLPDDLFFRIAIGLLSICLVASSNYVINEVLDAPYDVHHPSKRFRAVPSGRVNIPLAYLQWIWRRWTLCRTPNAAGGDSVTPASVNDTKGDDSKC